MIGDTPARDTIAALATAPGSAGVAIVRISGPQAGAIAEQLTGRTADRLPHAQLCFGPLRDAQDAIIDRGYTAMLRAPRSFTGEDVAELHVHGSPAVVSRLLAVIAQLGARAAQPGEFTLRAFEHGRLDLTQAEALLDLVSARSEAARVAALQHLDGALGRLLAELRTPILHALAEVEARLDFLTEAGVSPLDRAHLISGLLGLCERLDALRHTARAGRVRLHGARVVLFGAPNAGKSTLLNALTGLDRALVDARPGTTRDTIEVTTAPGGVAITWVDTAGVRADPPAGVDPRQQPIDPVEKQGAARARAEADHADVLVWVQDGSQPPPSLNLQPPVAAGQTLLIVRSKADLPVDPQIAAELADGLPVSVHAASGVAELRDAVTRAVHGLTRAPQAETVAITRQRHADCLEAAAAALVRAIAVLAADEPLELCADDLRDAAAALADMTGEVTGDDVLGAIFAQFCIGK